jgi:hypothetical protein
MRLGVTGRSRTGTGGVPSRSSATELREITLNWLNAPLYLLSYLGILIWRLVRESNPRLPARQAGTLATELTKRCCIGGGDRGRTCSLPLARRLLYRVLSYTPKEFHPVTGSGAAPSLRPISTLEA